MNLFITYFKGITFICLIMFSGIAQGQEEAEELISKPTKYESDTTFGVKYTPQTIHKSNSLTGGLSENTEKTNKSLNYISPEAVDLNKNSIYPSLITSDEVINNEIKTLKLEIKKNKTNNTLTAMLKKQIISLKDRRKQIKKLRTGL